MMHTVVDARSRSRPVATAGRGGAVSGFTLIELMVTIAIAAILVMLAAPSFDNVALNSRLNSYANDLHASVNVARSEAIKRNSVTRLCASSSGNACGGSWQQGWIVIGANGPVLRAYPALGDGYAVLSDTTTISFGPTGVGANATVLRVCRASPTGSQERVVTVSATGRARIEKTTTGSCS